VLPLLYTELASWYRLLDPLETHEEEMLAYADALQRAGLSGGRLLELGSGAGNNAHYLSERFQCTLVDVAEPMLRLSRDLNPQCEHLLGDMRRLRLSRGFDAVLIHDAICHMATLGDLRAALETAFVHVRPGGVAIFAPDCTKETFAEQVVTHEASEGTRTLCCLDWLWDPEASDDTCRGDYAFLLRDGTRVRSEHETHIEGLFSRDTWMSSIRSVGFDVSTFARPIELTDSERPDNEALSSPYTGEVFIARRPS
jgi:SAM-dependent methyltransferase